MKKQIPAIVLIVFGLALAATNPVPGTVFTIIGVVVFVMTKKKNKKTAKQVEQMTGPVKYRIGLIVKSKRELAALREKNPLYDNPRNTGKPIYQYRFFEHECQLVPTDKTYNVMYNDVLVGYVPADEVGYVKEAMGHLIGEPVLTILGGGVKKWDGNGWITDEIATRAEVTLQYMR